jgi:flagellar basal-body rod modification protein FlgD
MPVANPINPGISGARAGDAARRDFTRAATELQEKNGQEDLGKRLNQISGGEVFDKESTVNRKPKNELGKDAFLKILMAQIQNQNPLDPMDSKEMTAQMAQFSSLEQLVNMNTKMDKFGPDKTQQFLNGTHLIGMRVKANSNIINLEEGKALEMKFQLPKDAEKVVVSVMDINGNKVRTIEREKLRQGDQGVKWDGRDDKGFPLASGEYMYGIDAATSTGERIPIASDFSGLVSGVQYERGQPVLLIDGKKVRMSDIRTVEMNSGNTAGPVAPASPSGQQPAATSATPSALGAPQANTTPPAQAQPTARPLPSDAPIKVDEFSTRDVIKQRAQELQANGDPNPFPFPFGR